MERTKEPIVLSNGVVCQQVLQADGSWLIVLPDDRESTDAEWLEICEILRKRVVKAQR